MTPKPTPNTFSDQVLFPSPKTDSHLITAPWATEVPMAVPLAPSWRKVP